MLSTLKKNDNARQLVLAIAVIAMELMSGMQTYLGQLIMPIMSADLHMQDSYGLLAGVGTLTSMIGLPIGSMLLRRYKLKHLLLAVTIVLCVGSIICASANGLPMYLVGSIICNLSGSCLAMTSIGAVALGLQGRARQLTLAFSSASWVISSIVGPMYAAWITHLLSWRWAMLIYLPFILIARFIITLNLHAEQSEQKSPMLFRQVLFMSAGITLTIVPLPGTWKIIVMLIGLVILAIAAVWLMPQGTFCANAPRKRALAGMFFLTGAYFTANELISLTAHDIYHLQADMLGWIILAGGLAWAIMGMICGLKPANTKRMYRMRAGIGVSIIVICSLVMSLRISMQWWQMPVSIFLITVWALCGFGMGITYVDTMNVFFEEPKEDDGISMETMAAASVIVESLASSICITTVMTIIGLSFKNSVLITTVPYSISWLIVCVLAMVAWWYCHRSGVERA